MTVRVERDGPVTTVILDRPAVRRRPPPRRRHRKYRCGACPLRGRTVRRPEPAMPTTRAHASFLAAMEEPRAEGAAVPTS
jgi:hypothetical protein